MGDVPGTWKGVSEATEEVWRSYPISYLAKRSPFWKKPLTRYLRLAMISNRVLISINYWWLCGGVKNPFWLVNSNLAQKSEPWDPIREFASAIITVWTFWWRIPNLRATYSPASCCKAADRPWEGAWKGGPTTEPKATPDFGSSAGDLQRPPTLADP